LVASGIPPLLIAVTVANYGLNFPIQDQWEFVKLLDKAATGQLGFKDFWEQHNEHRLILPRVVMLALARTTQWDIRYELAANVVVALCTLGMLSLLIERTVRSVAPWTTSWLILATSLLTFSLVQWENWLWGWQLQIFMNVLAAVVTVWALARWDTHWWGLAIAFLAAMASAFSFATGLILLVLIPFGLLIGPRCDNSAGYLRRIALIIAGGAGTGALYLHGFRYPGHAPAPSFLFSHPLLYGGYVLTYIGSSLGAWSIPVSAIWGAMGLVTFAWCGAWLWTRVPAYRRALMPWVLLGLYGISSGFMTGIGRIGFGVEQALSSRYVTISSLFWVSLAVIVVLAIAHLVHNATIAQGRVLTVVAVAVSLIMLAGVSYGVSSIRAITVLRTTSSELFRAGECLSYYDKVPDECLHALYPSVTILRERAHRLQELAVGPFARRTLEQPLSWYTLVKESEPAGYIDEVVVHEALTHQTHRSGDVMVSGWGMDPFSGSSARSVLVVVGGRVMGRATTGEQRADVAKALGQEGLLHSGWRFRFELFRVAPGPQLVEAYALLSDGRRIVQLAGSRVVEVREEPT